MEGTRRRDFTGWSWYRARSMIHFPHAVGGSNPSLTRCLVGVEGSVVMETLRNHPSRPFKFCLQEHSGCWVSMATVLFGGLDNGGFLEYGDPAAGVTLSFLLRTNYSEHCSSQLHHDRSGDFLAGPSSGASLAGIRGARSSRERWVARWMV